MLEKFYETKVEKNLPVDLEQKWEKWLEELNQVPNEVEIIKEDLTDFGKIVDFTFLSIYHTKIYSRLYLNKTKNNYPLIVYFHGSMSNMENPWVKEDVMIWVKEGFSVVLFDARNQGGHTTDLNVFSYPDSYYINQGIDTLETNYCRRLYLDGVKLLNICHDEKIFSFLAKKEIVVVGGSQGGEVSLAVACLSSIPFLCMPDIPSGCAIKERILKREGKYGSVLELKEKDPELNIDQIILNMGYFDLINLVDKIKCPVFASVGEIDNVCPGAYFYKAFQKIKTPKEMYIYGGYGHGGYNFLHHPKKLKYLKESLNLDKNNQLLFLEGVFKERIWGSNYFRYTLKYPLDDNLYGEMWSVSAHKEGLCKVVDGPFKGMTLDKIYEENKELFGINTNEFPLMVKLIHTNADLSVQVHPDDEYARKVENQFGKTECWYFLNETDSKIVLGHTANTKEEIKDAIEKGTLTELLKTVSVKKDDFVLIPSKTIHALTKGLLVVEIQQSSDVTYRLYDYNRKDKFGKLRPLHIEKALDVIEVPDHNNYPVTNYSTKVGYADILKSNYFNSSIIDIDEKYDLEYDEDTFAIFTIISGTIEVEKHFLSIGESFIALKNTKMISFKGNGRIIITRP